MAQSPNQTPWSGRPGSNRPPEAWKATALPNELLPLIFFLVLAVRNADSVWARMDSNHRTPKRTDLQSVAVGHLATYPLSHLPESNWRPTDYKSVALPAELRWQYPYNRCWILRCVHSIATWNGLNTNKELPPFLGRQR